MAKEIPNHLRTIRKSAYHYDLPEEKIAQYALKDRSSSKLLQYQQGNINHHHFSDIPGLIPTNSLLVGNDTKVIRARLIMHRKTGAQIEIFLLHPIDPRDLSQAMETQKSCIWECMVGNKKKWKAEEILESEFVLEDGSVLQYGAAWANRELNHISFAWSKEELSFAKLVESIGKIPLPPYIQRKATAMDQSQYQTVFAQKEGAVAAPTAGLHFTQDLLEELKKKGVEHTTVTLHVGAGTFLPVKEEEVSLHVMHKEQIVVERKTIGLLREKLGNIVAIGTTSLRLLESLYWLGLSLRDDPPIAGMPFIIPQYAPYQNNGELPPATEVLGWLEAFMLRNHLESWSGETQIFILPGYQFQLVSGLITNFHLPDSTLLMLIAAFIGDDWRRVYDVALKNDYRFLSYGDGSLLWRKS